MREHYRTLFLQETVDNVFDEFAERARSAGCDNFLAVVSTREFGTTSSYLGSISRKKSRDEMTELIASEIESFYLSSKKDYDEHCSVDINLYPKDHANPILKYGHKPKLHIEIETPRHTRPSLEIEIYGLYAVEPTVMGVVLSQLSCADILEFVSCDPDPESALESFLRVKLPHHERIKLDDCECFIGNDYAPHDGLIGAAVELKEEPPIRMELVRRCRDEPALKPGKAVLERA